MRARLRAARRVIVKLDRLHLGSFLSPLAGYEKTESQAGDLPGRRIAHLRGRAVFAHAYQTRNVSQASKQDAEVLVKEGKREEALRKYLSYLHDNDDDAETHRIAARLAFEIYQDNITKSTFQAAYEALNGALRKNPDSPEVHEKYADLMVSIGRFDDAREHFEWLTNPARGPHDPKFDVMLIVCYKRRAFNQKAVDLAAEMIGLDMQSHTFDDKKAKSPKVVEPYVILASMLRELPEMRNEKLADQIMNQLVKANDESFKAHLERARYLLMYRSPQAAAKDVERAVTLAPDDADVILIAAASATAAKKYDEAEKLLLRGLKLFPKNVGMYRQWSILKIDQGQIAEARKQVEAGLKQQPKEANLLWILTELKVQQKDHAGVRETLKLLAELDYNKGLRDLMEARILFLEGKWLAASQMFEKLRPLLVQLPEQTRQADLYAAQCYEQLGETDKQLEACRRVLSTDANNIAARVGVASGADGARQER